MVYAAEFFRWFSEEAVRIGGDGKTRIIVSKKPVGPCVLVTTLNFPLAMGTRKIGPAIAAGCTMVFNPASPRCPPWRWWTSWWRSGCPPGC